MNFEDIQLITISDIFNMETKLQQDLVTAMKEKNSLKVTVLKEIKTAFYPT